MGRRPSENSDTGDHREVGEGGEWGSYAGVRRIMVATNNLDMEFGTSASVSFAVSSGSNEETKIWVM